MNEQGTQRRVEVTVTWRPDAPVKLDPAEPIDVAHGESVQLKWDGDPVATPFNARPYLLVERAPEEARS